ncbi:unnamed protein product, partial [Mesorhabditis belari]|uniref:Elongation of very long chain fatty acids protein n=1 Tax=Mesorhabditis belari TaxID=2138241 RepID=A0AAF3J6L3_9BILA
MARYDYWPRYGLENYTYVLPFEDTFDSIKSTRWMQNNWQHAATFSALYVGAIFGGKKIMESRKPFGLDGSLVAWNAMLAIFSIFGFIRMTPEWIWSWGDNSFEYSICVASYAQGVTGFWTEKFAHSKVAELLDTAFIVLRKRPLIFLHWYHHITVLAYTWHAFKDHTASGRWFIWMNYGVHSFMYTYYALRAAKIHTPKIAAMTITVLQILQMVMGVYIGITVYAIKTAGRECQQTWENIAFCFAIYFSYFLLFCNFFYHAYLKKGNRYAKVKKTDENGNEATATTKQNGHSTIEHEDKSEPIEEKRITRRRVQKAD